MEDVAIASSGKIGLFLVISLSSYTNIAHSAPSKLLQEAILKQIESTQKKDRNGRNGVNLGMFLDKAFLH